MSKIVLQRFTVTLRDETTVLAPGDPSFEEWQAMHQGVVTARRP